MDKLEELYYHFGRPICWRCINILYNADLDPQNCIFEGNVRKRCPRCGSMQRLVIDLKNSGKRKLLFISIKIGG